LKRSWEGGERNRIGNLKFEMRIDEKKHLTAIF